MPSVQDDGGPAAGASVPPGRPVFVGGSGRSGTTITGSLIAAHAAYAGLWFEVKSHLAPGLLMRTRREPQRVIDDVRARFDSHFQQFVERERFEALVAGLDVPRDQRTPEWARSFVDNLMAELVGDKGKPAWVEMTPLNAMWTDWLLEVYPDMRMLHMVRDGRDVAFSTSAAWGRMTPEEALRWWGERIRRILTSFERAQHRNVLTMRFERLALTDRETALAEIAGFLGVEVDAGMRAAFEESFQPSKANIGRWRRDLSSTEQERFTTQYREILSSVGSSDIDWLESAEEL